MKNYLNPTDGFHEAVENALENLPEREARPRGARRSLAALAAAAALVLAVGVGASSLVKWQSSWSSAEPDFTELPSQQELERRFGYRYKAVEKFGNGFEYTGGFVTHNEQYGEEGEALGEYESFSCEYSRGKSYVTLMTHRAVEGEIEGEVAEEYNGIAIHYTASTFFLVPDDLKITDEDEAALGRGEYSFSFGDYEPTDGERAEIASGESRAAFSYIGSENQAAAIKHQKSVEWVDGGMLYWISFVGGGGENIDKAELIGMAKEIIGGSLKNRADRSRAE